MPDHEDRLDAFLNAESDDRESDDLTTFTQRVMREGALPEPVVTEPTQEQRDRIRERVFGEARIEGTGGEPVTTPAFSANGAVPTAIPAVRDDGSRTSGLSILMTAAIIALIAVASLGVYRGSIDFLPGGADPNPTGAPGIAAPYEASPEALDSCDRDQWISVFHGDVPEILADAPHVTLEDGTLIWHCSGMSENLATGVQHAGGAFWPGVIALITVDSEVRLLNIASRDSIELDGAPLLNEDGKLDIAGSFVWSGGPEPWVIAPVTDELTDWRVIDVRSMESFLLSAELGDALPRAFTPSFGHITGTDVAVVTWNEPLPNLPSTPQPGGTNGVPSLNRAALVLPGSIEDRRWIEIVNWNAPLDERIPRSQVFSVNLDGSLIGYTTVTDTFTPVIRIEEAVTGRHVVDVPIDDIDIDTKFMLAGSEPHLVYSNGDTVRIFGFMSGDVRETATFPDPEVHWFYPTADPDTVLIGYSTGATPVNVESGEIGDFYNYVPSIVKQFFGSYEMPDAIVRVVSSTVAGTPATIHVVDPSTGDVLVESDPIDAHPVQIVSFDTWLRDGGTLAIVQVAPERAIILNAMTGETWTVTAPESDVGLWHFYPSLDGRFITAYPEPPLGTSEITESWIAPFEPESKWVSIKANNDVEAPMIEDGTPAS